MAENYRCSNFRNIICGANAHDALGRRFEKKVSGAGTPAVSSKERRLLLPES